MPEASDLRNRWFGRLVAEVRRRHVGKVLGAYLIMSWGIVEVSSTVFPLLRFPAWSASLVVVLLLLGLPVVAILAWTFDLTSEGIHRTRSTAPLVAPLRFRRGPAIAVVVLALLSGAWVSWNKRRIAEQVDPTLVAVLPFHVAASSELNYLSDGMVDLLAIKLSGEGGIRTVNPRTAIKAWQGVATSKGTSADERDALRAARTLGAGQFLVGNVVETANQISIAATLFGSITGGERVRTEVSGPADSLLALVDRLAAELLSRSAGESFDRIAQLTTTSLPALKLYLEGRSAYRNGDFSRGQHLLERALVQDSAFALAGLAHALVSRWTNFDRRGMDIAWANRARLPPRDLALLNALNTGDRSLSIQLAAWEAAATASPDDPEAVFELGDMYYHFGAVLGHADAEQRALTAMRRSLELDSTFILPLSHMFVFDAVRSDETVFRTYADTYLRAARPDQTDDIVLANKWLIALSLRDSALLRAVHAERDSAGAGAGPTITMNALAAGLSPDDAEPALARAARVAVTADERAAALITWANHEALVGHPTEAARLLREAQKADTDRGRALRIQITYAISYDGDTTIAAHAARSLAAVLGNGVRTGESYLRSQCELAYWDLLRGDAADAASRVAVLRANSLPADSTPDCVVWLDAWLAHLRRDASAGRLLARLDSLLLAGAFAWHHLPRGNITSMQLHEERGEYDAALAAARRQLVGFALLPDLPSQLMGQARLAARQGYRAEAVRAYQRYLAIRHDPEPGTRAEAAASAARLELARLSVERP